MKSNNYVLKPELMPYKGIVITKDTELKFKNDKVEQEIKDLKLKSVYVYENAKYTNTSILELNLEEGEILLLEEENRGYFLPQDIGICTINEAIEDLKTLKIALEGEKDDIIRNEKESIKNDRRNQS